MAYLAMRGSAAVNGVSPCMAAWASARWVQRIGQERKQCELRLKDIDWSDLGEPQRVMATLARIEAGCGVTGAKNGLRSHEVADRSDQMVSRYQT
jgi:hypothetical protein